MASKGQGGKINSKWGQAVKPGKPTTLTPQLWHSGTDIAWRDIWVDWWFEDSTVVVRVSRESFEVLSQNPAPTARVSRESFEVLSQNPSPTVRVTRMGFEVLQSVNELIGGGGGGSAIGWWGSGQGW